MTVTPPSAARLGSAEELALRLAVPQNAPDTAFGVTVVDSAGRATALGDVTVTGLPGGDRGRALWAQEVRVPRKGVRDVARLTLTPRGTAGTAWLVDAWGWAPGLPDPRPSALPRVDVGGLVVDEGDTGERTYQVPVKISGDADGRLQLSVVPSSGPDGVTWSATVRPGQTRIDVPVTVRGDTVWNHGTEHIQVLAKAETGLVVGDFVGTVDVRNDDPPGTLTVTPVADRVSEGGSLTWRFTLSAPSEAYHNEIVLLGLPNSGGAPELSTTDVDPQWLRDVVGVEPEPSRPLFGEVVVWVGIPAGELSAEITIPTVADGDSEGEERIELQVWGVDQPPLVGTVAD